MLNYSYDINVCMSALRSELTKLIIAAVLLLVVFTAAMIFSVSEIKDGKKQKKQKKKWPYVQAAVLSIVFCLLLFFMGRQIVFYSEDLTQSSFAEYKGPATIKERKLAIGFKSVQTEYVISFEQDGREVELLVKKEPDRIGDVDEIFIVYAVHSEVVIEFDVIQ